MNNPDLTRAPETPFPLPGPLYLRRSGTSLLIDFRTGEPALLHFGADLGPALPDLSLLGDPVPHSALDIPVTLGLIPQASSGWRGRPGLRGHRNGLAFSARLRVSAVERSSGTDCSAIITQSDPTAGVTVRTEVRINDGGLLQLRHRLDNNGTDPYSVEELAAVLPVGRAATEILDLTGRWCRESHPQRMPLGQGTWVRSGRHGRTGHDASLLLAAGTPGFGNRHGQVWAVHLGWSGNHESFVDAAPDGRTVIGASELLGSGEITLPANTGYETPWLFAAYSAEGLDGISDAFYAWFRQRPHHPGAQSGKARPVVLNVWEAVYFDHRMPVLLELAESAARLGVERYVLDDGWFRGRRHDGAGLGDWYVDEDLWPEGLSPLIDAVTGHGMEFGLWVEPEMVNEDSDLARTHPGWIAGPAPRPSSDGGPAGRLPERWRHQQVLDLVNPAAWQYIFDRLDALLRENNITYLKWDQNRDLGEMGHDGQPSVHAQTGAVYRLLDELRKAHPGVEIESCSSGGARVDLGILERTDRIWGSDCNDALERQTIQRWTGIVVPPELVGSHIGPTRSHTTARTHDLSFRAITAMFGHFGLEWDVRHLDDSERTELAAAIALFKEYRSLLHTGRMVRADEPDPALRLHGVVSHDGGEALFALVSVATSFAEVPGRIAIPGLLPDAVYRVEAVYPAPDDMRAFLQAVPPAWLAGGVSATGRFLAGSGLPMPVLNPEHGLLLTARRVTAAGPTPAGGHAVRSS
ncbi:alpha-galactosidase [Pseudarthrobacter sp. PH31-O2]|uniref:alpha-galactosidase n=1 Tax=Pseudarthrobacter sp. PH31-O2 TaxID=3046206 RepID=UPI0024BA2792|nr:alpha-galactosidase [Pseudarthrobacter sp. PH31-O2]MDJ0352449.1 alpha-galactosidase [Pseudarthrobacter sp. PH31-O2]